MTDFRALCEELVDELQEYIDADLPVDGNLWRWVVGALAKTELLVNHARAALAEQPVGPTDEALLKTYCDARRAFYFEAAEGESDQEDRKAAAIAGLRAVLARWGQP